MKKYLWWLMKSLPKDEFATIVHETLYNSIIADLDAYELDDLDPYSDIYDRPQADAEVLIVAQQVLNEEGID